MFGTVQSWTIERDIVKFLTVAKSICFIAFILLTFIIFNKFKGILMKARLLLLFRNVLNCSAAYVRLLAARSGWSGRLRWL